MLTHTTTHRIVKSNQLCFLLPWEAPRDTCPYPSNYVMVCLPRKLPKGGNQVDMQVVRLDNLRKQVDNTTLPKGKWIHLT
jgi:hypothetical protein